MDSFTQRDTRSYQDRVEHVLRCCRRDLPEMIRGCRNVVEYARPARWNFAFTDYLNCVRRYSEMCAEANELGFAGSLTTDLEPLKIWNDDYRWGDVLARVGGRELARAA